LKYNYFRDLGVDFEFQSLTYEDISSTELRKKISNGEDVSSFVPLKVKEYIVKNELYKD
jgi:nicotinic acid mononucleotide adenylyltransferase